MNETEDLIKRSDVIQALVDCYDIKGTVFLVSTKAELITEKVNEWIEANPDVIIWNIVPFMSYTTIKEKGAMMIGCMIEYNFLRDKNS